MVIVYDHAHLVCKYTFSSTLYLNNLVIYLPLILSELISIITIIMFYRFYKTHPEDITRKIMCKLNSSDCLVSCDFFLLQPRDPGQALLPNDRGAKLETLCDPSDRRGAQGNSRSDYLPGFLLEE